MVAGAVILQKILKIFLRSRVQTIFFLLAWCMGLVCLVKNTIFVYLLGVWAELCIGYRGKMCKTKVKVSKSGLEGL